MILSIPAIGTELHVSASAMKSRLQYYMLLQLIGKNEVSKKVVISSFTDSKGKVQVTAIYQSIQHQIKDCDIRMLSAKLAKLCYSQDMSGLESAISDTGAVIVIAPFFS